MLYQTISAKVRSAVSILKPFTSSTSSAHPSLSLSLHLAVIAAPLPSCRPSSSVPISLMPRPRRAAAARAYEAWSKKTKSDHETNPTSTATIPTPPRPHRTSIGSSKRPPLSLTRRRVEFDRLAAHHVAVGRASTTQATPLSSSRVTDLGSDKFDAADDEIQLKKSFAERILEEADVEKRELFMRGIVQRLRKIDQRGEEDGSTPRIEDDLKELAEILSGPRFLSHQAQSLRLLVACALAELFRISAPDPLVSAQRLDEVCGLFMEQLAVLVIAEDKMGLYRFSLLEQLANVKTFVIFAEDEGVICELFALFYAIARAHQGVKVREYMANILIGMLEEAEEIGISVLDAMLAPLVPALKYSPGAVALANVVLKRGMNAGQMALCSLLNASIRHSRKSKSGLTPDRQRKRGRKRRQEEGTDEDDEELSEHHEHIAEMLVAINRIAPDTLIYVIPSLEDRIRAADEAVRWANVHILSRLFASRRDMVDSYPSLFEEFLSRIRDVSPVIRAELCESFVGLMDSQPKHREKLDLLLRERLLDREEEVRVAAVRVVGESVAFASDELLKLMSSRLRDRKPSVRGEALKQLSDLYNTREVSLSKGSLGSSESQSAERHLELPGAEEGRYNDENNVETAREDLEEIEGEHLVVNSAKKSKGEIDDWLPKVSWLPQTLVQAHVALRSAGDAASANEIERVIFEKIPGATRDDEEIVNVRFRRFATFLAGLDGQAFNHVAMLAQERQKCRESLLRIANYRLRSRKRPQTSSNSSSPMTRTFSKRRENRSPSTIASVPKLDATELHELAKHLARFFITKTGVQGNVQNSCISLSTAVDLRIYERLFSALDGKLSYSQRSASCHDILSRLGSKTDLGEFVERQVFRKCRPGVFTSLYVKVACNIAIDENGQVSEVDSSPESQETQGKAIAMCGILRYLDLTSKFFPNLLEDTMESVKSLVKVDLEASDWSSDLILMGLKMVSRIPTTVGRDETREEFDGILRQWMLSKSLFDVGQGARIAKWSTKAAISLHSENNENVSTPFLQELVKDVASQINEFRGNVEQFIAPLTTSTQLAKHRPKDFQPIALECFDFARALLCGSFNSGVGNYLREASSLESRRKERNNSVPRHCFLPSALREEMCPLPAMATDFNRACIAELVHRAIKLLVYAFSVIESVGDELKDVFSALLHVLLEKNGDVFSISNSDSEDSTEENADNHEMATKESMAALCARARLSAGRGMLYLARHPKFFRQFTPSLLVSTVLLAQDEQPDVRMAFASTVAHQVMTKRLPFRWTVALPLMAVDPMQENAARIRSLLTTAFRNRRRLFERAKLEGRPSCVKLLPEAIVPEFIWVLANLPDIGVDQEQGYREAEKCLDLLLNRLLESNEYAGVIQEFIESLLISKDVSEREEDGPGEKTQRIYAIARITGVLLKRKQSGKKWNLSHHPGDISLPTDMFRVINRESETSGVPPPSLVDVARMYDSDQKRVSGKKERPHTTVQLAMNTTPSKLHSTAENGVQTRKDADLKLSSMEDEASTSIFHSAESEGVKTTLREGDNSDRMGSETPRAKQSSPQIQKEKRGTKRRSADSVVAPSNPDELQSKRQQASGSNESKQGRNVRERIARRTRPVSQQLISKTRKKSQKSSKPRKVVESATAIGDVPVLRRSSRLKRT